MTADIQACQDQHLCHCGTGNPSPHPIGTGGCVRFMTEAPQPFGADPESGHPHWLAEGNLITEFTLKQQRGYSRHDCGCWSRWDGSDNSIEA